MRTIASEAYAPITTRVGYLHAPLAAVTEELVAWRRELHGSAVAHEVKGEFPGVLACLEPLSVLCDRELLVPVGNEWVAYFDCSASGTDPVGAVSVLGERLDVLGLVVDASPHIVDPVGESVRRYGGVAFYLFGSHTTSVLNYVRTVQVSHTGSRWEMHVSGEPQPYEELERYQARRVRDRFTSDMLERYCQALGVDVFNTEAYGASGMLIKTDVVSGREFKRETLQEVQARFSIVPGEADLLPG